jgi:indole-3-glycerol phosphate synthase
MNKVEHGSILNFNYILEVCKRRYVPFDKKVEKKREPKSLFSAIREAGNTGKNTVIAEVKYCSPTKTIREADSPEGIALEMIDGGACAISVLTEPEFFGGSLENLQRVKSVSGEVPVLRKDFIFHPTQIPESYYYGADSVLLIASFFATDDLQAMISGSRSFGMEPLVEVHSIGDIQKAQNSGALIYAINNRDKETLEIDLNRTARMAPHIKGTKVSASGIETPSQLKDVLKFSDAALIGSSIMGSEDIASKVAEFVEA